MVTIHNSANTEADVYIREDEFPNLGPFDSYVGSYDNLREVAKAAALDVMTKAGWESPTVSSVELFGNGFLVKVVR